MLIRKFLIFVLSCLFALALCGVTSLVVAYYVITPQLPDSEMLRDVRFQVPLRIYSREGKLIAEYGEKRRVPLDYSAIPPRLVKAFLAAEDDRFFEHPGVDYQGILRAVWVLVTTGKKGQGGSTITMQLARNFFLSNEKTYVRKFKEILLSLKIEEDITKEEILELYLNKIYLGHRSYGVGAAAQVYYGTEAANLSLAQTAMIAGLPKAPSRYNPITNPKRATIRRNYVLRRMLELNHISQAEYDEALDVVDDARWHGGAVEIAAPYVAEIVRSELVKTFGEEIYADGTKVYTTISAEHQKAANQAVRNSLIGYDQRRGYRGIEKRAPLEQNEGGLKSDAIADLRAYAGIEPAIVSAIAADSMTVIDRNDQWYEVSYESMKWAAGNKPSSSPSDLFSIGDVVRIIPQESSIQASLAQVPEVEGALVSMNAETGEITALVGGLDYNRSKFNRATQAKRQMGSVFKPFLYSAALEHEYTLASIINDTAVVFDDTKLEGTWRPQNYSKKFYGPTRFREALVKSRNLVSVKILQDIGIRPAIAHVSKFGFDKESLPRDLSLSLGSAAVSPLEVAKAYAVFANGGFLVDPYVIETVERPDGELVYWQDTQSAAEDNLPPQPVIDQRNIYLMSSVLREVVQRGTAVRAKALGRRDIAGKTGTTNDQRDAWFAGFNQKIVAVAWTGFDDMTPLGSRETGSRAALPMWIDYMQTALKGIPESEYKTPDGIVQVKIDKETGERATPGTSSAMFEIFKTDNVPAEQQSIEIDQPQIFNTEETESIDIF